jgi:NADH-quinone oxidoreductase subunit M
MNVLILVVVVLPIFAAFLASLMNEKSAKSVAILGSAVACLVSILGITTGGQIDRGFHHVVNAPWLPKLGLTFSFGLDGMSSLLVLLTTFLTVVSVIVVPAPKHAVRAYYVAILVAGALTNVAFASLNVLLFYIAFEAALIPVLIAIGMFGGGDRSKAAIQFFVFTVIGSLLLLSAIIGLRIETGSFDYLALKEMVVAGDVNASSLRWFAIASFVAFATKAALVPLHAWLGRAYVNTPTGMLLLLSGAMAKLGIYGLIRFTLPLGGEFAQSLVPFIVTLGAVSVIYGAIVAAAQSDIKAVIAFSSISHMGYIVIGAVVGDDAARSGSVLQMLNHGITTGALFICCDFISRYRGSRQVADLGGIWSDSPLFSRLLLLFTFSSVALPLTNGFVGELLILLGAFPKFPIQTSIAAAGAVGSAVYMLWMIQRSVYGAQKSDSAKVVSLGVSERSVLLALALMIIGIGIAPSPLLAIASDNGYMVGAAMQPEVK